MAHTVEEHHQAISHQERIAVRREQIAVLIKSKSHMPIIKIAIYATEVACAVLVEVKAGITIRTARGELNVQIAAKRENAEHATDQARFLGQLNGIEFVKVLQNKIGGAKNSADFIYGGSFGNAADEGLFHALLDYSRNIVILQGESIRITHAEDIRVFWNHLFPLSQ